MRFFIDIGVHNTDKPVAVFTYGEVPEEVPAYILIESVAVGLHFNLEVFGVWRGNSLPILSLPFARR